MPDTIHSVTCPQKTRTKNRRKTKAQIYASKSWKDNKAQFVEGKVCVWCGSTEKLLPHHPYKNTPDGIYEDLYLSECIVLCGSCHFRLEKRHEIQCPVCKENWMPIDPAIDRCFKCHLKANPGKAEAIAAEKERREVADRQYKKGKADTRKKDKSDFPCNFRRVEQGCSKYPGVKCGYSKTKAKNCPDFKAKTSWIERNSGGWT